MHREQGLSTTCGVPCGFLGPCGSVCEDLHAGSLFLHLHAEPFSWLPKVSNVFQISYCPKVWPEFGHQEYDGISSQFFPALLLRVGGGRAVQAALHGRGSLHLQHPESWAWPWVFIQGWSDDEILGVYLNFIKGWHGPSLNKQTRCKIKATVSRAGIFWGSLLHGTGRYSQS